MSAPVTTASITEVLASAAEPDRVSAQKVRARIDDILRPQGAMSRFDEVAEWLALWQRTDSPSAERPAAVIFAADHGVVTEGVSAYPQEVTAAMLAAFEEKKASVSALARVAGATVTAVDVGVGNPTGNLRIEPALTPERLAESFRAGRQAVAALDTDLLIVGEMGIGNTTAASAVSAALLNQEAIDLVGRGTGIADEALSLKQMVVADALTRIEDETDPVEILRQVGGAELAAIAGALLEARVRSIPVLLDGFIATSPALVLHSIDPELVANCWAGHQSAEPGHQLVLKHLGLEPLLILDMRLGEASGAMAAVPLVRMACALTTEVPTFAEWFGPGE